MAVTKEEVLARASELGQSLTDAQVEQFVQEGKLPEKQIDKREELKNLPVEKLIDKIQELTQEAAGRRVENKGLKEAMDALKAEASKDKEFAAKYPQLESQLKAIKDAENTRRAAIITKLGDKGRALAYLVDVEKIGADQFDATIELFADKRGNGTETPPPGKTDKPNPFKAGKGFSLTEQGRIMKEDPTLAQKLKSEASQ